MPEVTSRVQSEESETGHYPAQAVIGYLEQNALSKVDLYVKWHTIGIPADQISKKAVFVKWSSVHSRERSHLNAYSVGSGFPKKDI